MMPQGSRRLCVVAIVAVVLSLSPMVAWATPDMHPSQGQSEWLQWDVSGWLSAWWSSLRSLWTGEAAAPDSGMETTRSEQGDLKAAGGQGSGGGAQPTAAGGDDGVGIDPNGRP